MDQNRKPPIVDRRKMAKLPHSCRRREYLFIFAFFLFGALLFMGAVDYPNFKVQKRDNYAKGYHNIGVPRFVFKLKLLVIMQRIY